MLPCIVWTVKGSFVPARNRLKTFPTSSPRKRPVHSGRNVSKVLACFQLTHKNPLLFMQQPAKKPPFMHRLLVSNGYCSQCTGLCELCYVYWKAMAQVLCRAVISALLVRAVWFRSVTVWCVCIPMSLGEKGFTAVSTNPVVLCCDLKLKPGECNSCESHCLTFATVGTPIHPIVSSSTSLISHAQC